MKKIFIFLISLLLVVSLFGCVKEETEINNSSSSSVTASVTDESTTEKETVSSTIKEEETTKKNETATKKATTTKKESTTKKETTTKTTTSSSTVTCYVTIEYTAILDNMDKLTEGHEKYVNKNGYALSKEKVTVKKGSSAYQAVKTACDSNGIKVSTTGSGKSVYISGFANIDEKDCTSSSGWTYYVNGYFPPKNCGAYTVSDGDEIKFSYVVESK